MSENLFCSISELQNESDVEQKFVMPLLTSKIPLGLGFDISDIHSKPNIKRFQIEKGTSPKVYFPDYVLLHSGLPVAVIEVKNPTEDILSALREARLYATELNAQFGTEINPCKRVIATNGMITISSFWDTTDHNLEVEFQQVTSDSPEYSNFVRELSKDNLGHLIQKELNKFPTKKYSRPLNLLGGKDVRNQEINPNTFGASFALDYRHLFNPINEDQRAYIVKNAYVDSRERERYSDEIDRIIRAVRRPSVAHATKIKESAQPLELTEKLLQSEKLEHQILLLIGGVGAGKSTFVDHLKEVSLPEEVKKTSLWVHVNLNEAPLNKEDIYQWLTNQLVEKMKFTESSTNFDDLTNLEKLYHVELKRLKDGPLKLLDASSLEYKSRIVDWLVELQKDKLTTLKALERYLGGERGRLLIVVLDNCDKRNRDEQLLMFEVAQWVQKEFRCLLVLPLRDVTYDLHRNEPPLDTALKDLTFRIEPPIFTEVLRRRILLALKEMKTKHSQRTRTYILKNNMRVEYPITDLASYLICIIRSLYEYDQLIRQTISGIAGRNIRRAMEIFLEFCTSGYIDEREIFKIKQSEGQYTLPYHIINRVLFRMNRRFYSGNHSYVKNILNCDPTDIVPNYLDRVAILRWLFNKYTHRGPTFVRGFHPFNILLKDLMIYGHDAKRIKEEVLYLIRAGCIIPEHQRYDDISEDDLISISSAGIIHLKLLKNADYLAACAEDLWYSNEDIATAIRDRIARFEDQLSLKTKVLNTKALYDYLVENRLQYPFRPESIVENYDKSLHSLEDLKETVVSSEEHAQKIMDKINKKSGNST
jgi:tRNA A37 threonylcarbamoyladenosine biosynthesis protein TsaE